MLLDGHEDPGADPDRLLVVDVEEAVLTAGRPAPILHATDF